MKQYTVPSLTGTFTTCKICNVSKDDAYFKQSNGKRNGLVCRDCDCVKKVKGYVKRYNRKPSKYGSVKERLAAWYKRNKLKHAVNCKKYANKNKEKIAAKQAETFQKNKDARKLAMQEWRKKNPKMITFYTRKYNLGKEQRTPIWANLEAIKQIYKNCPEGYEVDHIIPLHGKNVSGLHVENNLQYLTKMDNTKKAAKWKQESN